ncbi:MAG TPA: 5-dehydro-2-deoxygluconokinase [Xanthobacteraceae bacterium]|jgi:5-dehydro-2-deoxygluconokinase
MRPERGERSLDLVTLGRAAVDLYGEQIGGRLEDMSSFAKYLGGCPANIAVGAARLGLNVGIITRVGDDHMGRFVREALAAEGIDVSQVKSDPGRLTGLVILGIRDSRTFPLIFYRENCADMALEAADIDAAFIARSRALVVTGTHLSTPKVLGASHAAIAAARSAGSKVVLDIDYRPVLWGLTGRGEGEIRFVGSPAVTARLQKIVPDCDLVVGTEDEIHIAGGATDTVAALRRLRELTGATLVVKRGESGAVIFDGAIPNRIEQAVVCPGFPVDVFNVLGAGDGFMAGLLFGWLRGLGWSEAGRIANACGALVVSRHGCAPAMPTKIELDDFLLRAGELKAAHSDARIAHLHRVTTRHGSHPEVLALAFDHRRQFEELCQRWQTPIERIQAFKMLICEAVEQVYRDVEALGVIVDDSHGRAVLDRLTGTGMWIGRPVERAGSRPLAFKDSAGPALALRGWPTEHVAKCLVIYDPADPENIATAQEGTLLELERAADATGHEWMLELIPPAGGRVDDVVPAAVQRLYSIGLTPDWWKLPPSANAATWRRIGDLVRTHDELARGIMVLGLDAPEAQLGAAFVVAAQEPLVRGFAVGRTIFWATAEKWFGAMISDSEAVGEIAASYRRIIGHWRRVRPVRGDGLARANLAP